jgi:imidazolonepropionase
MNNSTPWLITNIGTLGPLHPAGTTWLKGADMANFPTLENAWLLTDSNGCIVDFGAMDTLPTVTEVARYHAQGGWLMPGFIDSHTHLVFGKWREAEMVSRIQGETYEEIAQKGGVFCILLNT